MGWQDYWSGDREEDTIDHATGKRIPGRPLVPVGGTGTPLNASHLKLMPGQKGQYVTQGAPPTGPQVNFPGNQAAVGFDARKSDQQRTEEKALLDKRVAAREQAQEMARWEQQRNPTARIEDTGGGRLMDLLRTSRSGLAPGVNEERARQITGDAYMQQRAGRDAEDAERAAKLKAAQNVAAEPDYATKQKNEQAEWEKRLAIQAEAQRQAEIEGQGRQNQRDRAKGRQQFAANAAEERRRKEAIKAEHDYEEQTYEKRQAAQESRRNSAMRDELYRRVDQAEQIANQYEPVAESLAKEGRNEALQQVYQSTAAASEAMAAADQEAKELAFSGATPDDPRMVQARSAGERAAIVLNRLKAIQNGISRGASRGAADREDEKGRESNLERTRKRVGIMDELSKANARLSEQAQGGIESMKKARSGWLGDDPMMPMEKLLRQWSDPYQRAKMRPVEVEMVRDWLRKTGGGDEQLVRELEQLIKNL